MTDSLTPENKLAAHTRGPWSYERIWDIPEMMIHADGVSLAEAFTMDDPGEKEANARLIAAAPDLLKELKSMVRAYVELLEGGHDRIVSLGGTRDPVDVMESGDPKLISAKAAIAKATRS